MKEKQYWNEKIGAWVKADVNKKEGKTKVEFTKVKKQNPEKPYKNIPKGNTKS